MDLTFHSLEKIYERNNRERIKLGKIKKDIRKNRKSIKSCGNSRYHVTGQLFNYIIGEDSNVITVLIKPKNLSREERRKYMFKRRKSDYTIKNINWEERKEIINNINWD